MGRWAKNAPSSSGMLYSISNGISRLLLKRRRFWFESDAFCSITCNGVASLLLVSSAFLKILPGGVDSLLLDPPAVGNIFSGVVSLLLLVPTADDKVLAGGLSSMPSALSCLDLLTASSASLQMTW